MSSIEKKEVWLRGPVNGITALLQPVAHALLQAREEVDVLAKNFPDALLWNRPANLASAGFHLQHLSGVLDRLFSYAKGLALSAEQFDALATEGIKNEKLSCTMLMEQFDRQVSLAIEQLRVTPSTVLLETRLVGRGMIPSTVLGLLVHAAEHTQRHVGQLLVTMRVLENGI